LLTQLKPHGRLVSLLLRQHGALIILSTFA
jgi:hypothetical protein